MNARLLLILVVAMPLAVAAQQGEWTPGTAERVADLAGPDRDGSAFAMDFSDRLLNPVDLNRVKREEELDDIPFLDPTRRASLYIYLVTYGEVLSVYELAAVPGFDSLTLSRIAPFVSIRPKPRVPPPTPGNLVRHGSHSLVMRGERTWPPWPGSVQADNDTTGPVYPGNPWRYYFRYTYHWFDRISAGLAGEKDPGERFFEGAQRLGMDYYAGYVSVSHTGILENLTLGNFRVSFGEGLTIGQGGFGGAGPGFLSDVPPRRGIRATLGMDEVSSLRGAAITLRPGNVDVSAFLSRHPRDGVMAEAESLETMEYAADLSGSGYHRTDTEIERRNKITETVYGGNIGYSLSPGDLFGFRAGVTAVAWHYTPGLAPGERAYERYYFAGSHGYAAGTDIRLRWRRLHFSGEVSSDGQGSCAWLVSLAHQPDPRLKARVVFRDYPRDYRNLFAAAFGRNRPNANERGLFISATWQVVPTLSLEAYLDLFVYPWMKYRMDAPGQGHETALRLSWRQSAFCRATVTFRTAGSPGNETAATVASTRKLVILSRSSLRADLEIDPSQRFRLRTHAEVCYTGSLPGEAGTGYLLWQEARITRASRLESLTVRYMVFDIPSYDSRIYVTEPDVLYGFSSAALQGKGVRACLLARVRL